MGFDMTDAAAPTPPSGSQPGAAKVRDVADFHLRWSEFRPIARGLGQSTRLTMAEADTLGWMIAVLDRIGPQDLDIGQD